MNTLKTLLVFLLFMFILGLVGSMDYDDEIKYQQYLDSLEQYP